MREKKPLVNINTTLDLLFGSAEPTLIIKLGLTVCISLLYHATEILEFIMEKLACLLVLGGITIDMNISCFLTVLMSPC